MLVDHDANFLNDPSSLFASSVFVSSGMLFFHDRIQMSTPLFPVRSSSRWVRNVMRRRAQTRSFYNDHTLGDHATWPWRPSKAMSSSPLATGLSNHYMDSSVLLISKTRAWRVVHSMYILHDLYRHEMYANLHGDKDAWWLACELMGDIRCVRTYRSQYSPTVPTCQARLDTCTHKRTYGHARLSAWATLVAA